MMYSNHHMTTAGWVFSALGMLIVLALAAAGIVWILATLRPRGGATPPDRAGVDASPVAGSRSHATPIPRAERLPDPPSVDEVRPREAAPAGGASEPRR